MIRIGLIGFGYRAKYFYKVIKNNNLYELVVIYGRGSHKEEASSLGIPYVTSVDEAISYNVDFFINTSSKKTIFQVSKSFLDKGQAVLQETPLSINFEELIVAKSYLRDKKFQVSEQYPYYSQIRRIKEKIDKGFLGRITELHFSVAHEYHAFASIRYLLNTDLSGFELYKRRYEEDITETKSRYNHSFDGNLKRIKGMNLVLSKEDLRVIYDYTSEEYRSTIRHPYIIVRGTRGEIINNKLYYLDESNKEHVKSFDLSINYEGEDLKTIEIILDKMSKYVKEGKTFYSIKEALIDSYLSYIVTNHFNENERIDYKEIGFNEKKAN